MKKFIYIAFLIFCSQKLLSQNNCENIIEEASGLYYSGNYDECIHILENGLITCNLSKNQKENAYVLLINSNIEKDSLQGIDKNFRRLLKNNPVFKIKEYSGLDDFKKYFNDYYVFPKLSIGIRPHYSKPKIWLFKTYQVMPNIKNQNEFNTSTFINTNLVLEYRLIEKISFFADAGLFTLSFNRELNDNYWQMKSYEKLKFLQLDIGNKYYFLKSQKKFNFYLMGGFSNQYLRKSELTLTQTINEVHNIYENVDATEYNFLDSFDSKKLRNSYVASLLFGTGAIYRIGYIGIGLDVRAYISANTLNNKTQRFSEPAKPLIKDFNYIDSDTRLVKPDFSVVFTYLLYKVKRKKLAKV